jgi:Fe-S-cluster formation regulator IscX/YfhJ
MKYTFTRPIGLATEVFEVYPNIDPKTRRVIRSDGTKGPKMPVVG